MFNNFLKMVNEKIEGEEMLTVAMECNGVHIMDSITPDVAYIDDSIYITGGWFSLNIDGDFEIDYDDYEDEYIVRCGDTAFYFS